GQLALRPRPAQLVDDEPARDREDPRTQVLAVLERRVRTEGAQERLLVDVLGAVPAEPPSEEAIHLVAMRVVERLERRDHCVVKRTSPRRCEMWRSPSSGTSNGSSSPAWSTCRGQARSSTRRRPGRSPRAGAP